MMKVKKIAHFGNDSRPIEDLINTFFQQENISKSDIVHIRPIGMTSGGMSDLVAVYVFYDKFGTAEQSTQVSG